MDLHPHQTAAFRASDYKWGTPVNLDTCENQVSSRCIPAIIDDPLTTFSSEECLKIIKNHKHSNKTCNDSFTNMSVSRKPSISDLETETVGKDNVDSVRTCNAFDDGQENDSCAQVVRVNWISPHIVLNKKKWPLKNYSEN